MKKTITSFALIICLCISATVHAQEAPFMTYYISELQSSQKDTSGKWSEWKQDTKIKTIVADFYIAGNPDAYKLSFYLFKGKKPVEDFTFKRIESKEEKGYDMLILTEAKNSAGKPCTIEFKRSSDRSDRKIASYGVITIKYADEWIEYTGITK